MCVAHLLPQTCHCDFSAMPSPKVLDIPRGRLGNHENRQRWGVNDDATYTYSFYIIHEILWIYLPNGLIILDSHNQISPYLSIFKIFDDDFNFVIIHVHQSDSHQSKWPRWGLNTDVFFSFFKILLGMKSKRIWSWPFFLLSVRSWRSWLFDFNFHYNVPWILYVLYNTIYIQFIMCNYNYDIYIYNIYIYYYYYLKFLPGIMMCSNVWKSDPQFTTTIQAHHGPCPFYWASRPCWSSSSPNVWATENSKNGDGWWTVTVLIFSPLSIHFKNYIELIRNRWCGCTCV